jgi:predicted RecA/RadA family phage recombinase
MANKVQDGRHLTITKASVDASDPVVAGTLVGVALIDTNADGEVVIDTEGVWSLTCKGINGSGNSAIAVGDAIYYTSGDTPKLSKKATGTLFGYATSALNSAATGAVNVKIAATPASIATDDVKSTLDTYTPIVDQLVDQTTLNVETGDGAADKNAINVFSKGSAAAITLAAPAEGDVVQITSDSAFAHVVKSTKGVVFFKGFGCNGTTHDQITIGNTVGYGFKAVWESDTVWRLVDLNGTITPAAQS